MALRMLNPTDMSLGTAESFTSGQTLIYEIAPSQIGSVDNVLYPGLGALSSGSWDNYLSLTDQDSTGGATSGTVNTAIQIEDSGGEVFETYNAAGGTVAYTIGETAYWIVVIESSDGYPTFYYNDTELRHDDVPDTTWANTSIESFMIGYGGSTYDGAYLGEIYTIEWFDAPLTSAEISDYVNNGTDPGYTKVSSYTFDASSGATVTDQAGTNDLTINGTEGTDFEWFSSSSPATDTPTVTASSASALSTTETSTVADSGGVTPAAGSYLTSTDSGASVTAPSITSSTVTPQSASVVSDLSGIPYVQTLNPTRLTMSAAENLDVGQTILFDLAPSQIGSADHVIYPGLGADTTTHQYTDYLSLSTESGNGVNTSGDVSTLLRTEDGADAWTNSSTFTYTVNERSWFGIVIETNGDVSFYYGETHISTHTRDWVAVALNALFTGYGGATNDGDYLGDIFEVVWYDAALTAQEMADFATGSRPTYTKIAQWTFSEGSGTTVADSVGTNDLTIQGTEDTDFRWAALTAEPVESPEITTATASPLTTTETDRTVIPAGTTSATATPRDPDVISTRTETTTPTEGVASRLDAVSSSLAIEPAGRLQTSASPLTTTETALTGATPTLTTATAIPGEPTTIASAVTTATRIHETVTPRPAYSTSLAVTSASVSAANVTRLDTLSTSLATERGDRVAVDGTALAPTSIALATTTPTRIPASATRLDTVSSSSATDAAGRIAATADSESAISTSNATDAGQVTAGTTSIASSEEVPIAADTPIRTAGDVLPTVSDETSYETTTPALVETTALPQSTVSIGRSITTPTLTDATGIVADASSQSSAVTAGGLIALSSTVFAAVSSSNADAAGVVSGSGGTPLAPITTSGATPLSSPVSATASVSDVQTTGAAAGRPSPAGTVANTIDALDLGTSVDPAGRYAATGDARPVYSISTAIPTTTTTDGTASTLSAPATGRAQSITAVTTAAGTPRSTTTAQAARESASVTSADVSPTLSLEYRTGHSGTYRRILGDYDVTKTLIGEAALTRSLTGEINTLRERSGDTTMTNTDQHIGTRSDGKGKYFAGDSLTIDYVVYDDDDLRDLSNDTPHWAAGYDDGEIVFDESDAGITVSIPDPQSGVVKVEVAEDVTTDYAGDLLIHELELETATANESPSPAATGR